MILFGILRQLGIGTMANHVKPLDVASVGHFIPAGHWAFSAVFHTTSTWRLSGEGSCSPLAMRMISALFLAIQNMRAL